jgi:hypothetical protein
MLCTKTLCLVVLATTLALSSAAIAADGADFSASGERTLNGHSYMHSQYIKDPFVGTNFTNHVGVAVAPNFSRDFNDLDGNLLFTLDGNLIFASLGMGFQQHLGENWAVGLAASGLVRSGTDAPAFINDGANVNTNLNAWARRKLLRNKNHN